jgi:hypothetical protein
MSDMLGPDRPCRGCGRVIPEVEHICPYCGYDMRTHWDRLDYKLVAAGVSAVGGGFLGLCVWLQTAREFGRPEYGSINLWLGGPGLAVFILVGALLGGLAGLLVREHWRREQ